MHTKGVCSSSSQTGFGNGLEPAGNMHTDADAFASSGTEYDSCVIQERQDLVNCLSMCLSSLVETSNEVESMKEKIGELRGVMKEMQKNLNVLLQASLENRFGGCGSSFQTLLNNFNRLNVGDGKESCAVWNNNKTELCNKWQKTGTCHYGNNCQYAHGNGKLRPVIRQPCRMVLAGIVCPFGDRCHFRHELTEEEKARPISSIKLER
ncbi:zinc finger CCCH domain-containing protein 14-like [Vicia villosa]|uniref:zinc finger CCCH domain-containing protein 14-like n=1 Tax=Vicia villosa TaxID=3911 RepID=UPI00273BD81B|nr:zinc finger CCCH domain-containing protein 14-like [Vicia villosa]